MTYQIRDSPSPPTETPTPIYEYIEIDIIRVNQSTVCVDHIVVPIHYVHKKYIFVTVESFKLKTNIQPAFIGTKISNGPLLEINTTTSMDPDTTLRQT